MCLDYANGADGGNTEGPQYWQYGMENFLRFAVALDATVSYDGVARPAASTMAAVREAADPPVAGNRRFDEERTAAPPSAARGKAVVRTTRGSCGTSCWRARKAPCCSTIS
jgi:hypothetical protein